MSRGQIVGIKALLRSYHKAGNDIERAFLAVRIAEQVKHIIREVEQVQELTEQNKRYREEMWKVNLRLKDLFVDIVKFDDKSITNDVRRELIEISGTIHETLESESK